MAKYYQQTINAVAGPQKPQLEPLAGLSAAKRSRVPPLMRSQDKTCALGRRIVASQSLRGAATWSVSSGNPVGAAIFPSPTLERPVAHCRVRVTPGSFLRLSVLYSPAGQTQVSDGGAAYVSGGAGGSVIVQVVWTQQSLATTTTEHEVALMPSLEPLAAPSTAPWATLRTAGIDLITPEIDSSSDKRRWTEHVEAEVTILHRGGARVVDLCLHETPHIVVREADDTASFWTSHMLGLGSPEGPAQGQTTYAVQRWSETTPDGQPQGGTWQLMSTAAAQGLRLGPQLVHWTAWGESTADLFSSPNPPESLPFAGTSLVRLWDAGSGTYQPTGVGWSLSSGAYSSDAHECDDYWSDADRSVPVMVAVLANGRGLAPGLVRVQSSPFAWVDVVTATTNAWVWYFGYGHLRVGRGPDDQSVAQAFARRTGGSGAVDVAGVCVFRHGQHEPLS